jgi:hypothetical protein
MAENFPDRHGVQKIHKPIHDRTGPQKKQETQETQEIHNTACGVLVQGMHMQSSAIALAPAGCHLSNGIGIGIDCMTA